MLNLYAFTCALVGMIGVMTDHSVEGTLFLMTAFAILTVVQIENDRKEKEFKTRDQKVLISALTEILKQMVTVAEIAVNATPTGPIREEITIKIIKARILLNDIKETKQSIDL